MPGTLPDLWPEDIGTGSMQTPLAILKSEAALLGQKTDQLVTAEVVTQSQGELFFHSFLLVAPALDNYKYELFRVQHGVVFYPMAVVFSRVTETVESEEQFIDKLKRILEAPTTRNVVQSLIAQSRA